MTLQHLRGILTLKDDSYREVVADPSGLQNALIIFFSVSLIVASFQYVINSVLLPQLVSLIDPALAPEMELFTPIGLLTDVGLNMLALTVGGAIFVAGVLLFTRLLGSKKGSFTDIVTVFGHAYSVRVVGFIPLVGLASLVYYVIMCIKGLAAITDLSTARAAAAYFIVVGIVIVISIIVAIVLFLFFLSTMPF